MEKEKGLKNLGNAVNRFAVDAGKAVSMTTKEALLMTQDAGKKTVAAAQKGAADLADKMKNANYQSRLKKYNPIFPDVFYSESFKLPNLIIIKDDAIRRGIDVCEGAIGWLGTSAGTEILYLYDEEVEKCGLTFVPSPQCEAVYYVDMFDRSRFIRVEHIFSLAHEERLAELKHIAHALGAKKCTIQISEATQSSSKKEEKERFSVSLNKQNKATEEFERSISSSESNEQRGRIVMDLVGSETPQRPTLKWFAHDNNVQKLIDMRMERSINAEEFELIGSSSAAMAEKTACAIDSAIKGIGAKGNASIAAQAIKESKRRIFYRIEF